MNLALKVDVDTYRGTRRGVPKLVELFKKHAAEATFLFSLGSDNTGRAIKRVFRRGFLGKVRRTSVLSHYGLLTLMYGTVLPGPDIGRRCAEIMRRVRDEGFEVGIHTYDHVRWQDHVGEEGQAWTRRQMELACNRFRDIFGTDPKVHGAAGWCMNRHAYRLTQLLGFGYCSDTRGTRPYVPVYEAEIVACPQLPTTLPTLDELIGLDGVTVSNVAERVLDLSRDPPPSGHVFTLHAELEGMKLAPVLERLLEGWRAMGYRLTSLREYFESLPDKNLPRHETAVGQVPGRSGTLALQGPEFLAATIA
ncbi:MAG TPA: polysaccharide deacetylase family protein [Burkholderiales bacterium]|nr:polysaccharide deacetylase family protein [Burkholderiales bacterium]